MKIRNLYKIISPLNLNIRLDALAAELEDYDFNGVVDFSDYPVFVYDTINFVRVDGASDPETQKIIENFYKVIEDDKIINYSGKFETLTSARIKLSKHYDLQAFFNEYMDAKCIVFNLSTSGSSIYHDGYTIRVSIIDKNNEVVKFRTE
jgi:hypothetical protein